MWASGDTFYDLGWQECPEVMVGFVDSDFAGCARTRKSTAGGCIMWGGHMIESWAKTLPVLALSSGEAELMAVVRGAIELKGVMSLMRDFGV